MLPKRQAQALALLNDDGPLNGATFAKAMWMRHSISPGQANDLLRALRRKGLVTLEGRGQDHRWVVLQGFVPGEKQPVVPFAGRLDNRTEAYPPIGSEDAPVPEETDR